MKGKRILRKQNTLIQYCSLSLFFTFLLFGLLGCSSEGRKDASKGGDTTLIKVAFWGGPEEIEIITECIKDWERSYPHIKVRFEHTPYGGYVNKILTRIAGNAAPDVICTEVNYFVTFASKGVLYNLSSYIEADPHFKKEDFFPEVLDRFTVDGKIYAIPRDTAPFACLFYNKDLFDKAGLSYPSDDWNWNDLLASAQALTKRDDKGRVTQYGFYGWAWQNFVYGNGGSLVDDVNNPTICTLNSQHSIEGVQFYADLITKYRVMPTPVALTNAGMGVDYMFASGRLAMFLSGIWETPALRNDNFRWDVAMFPKNQKGIRKFGTGGSGYAVLESSNHKKEAWEVVKALTAAPAQIRLAEMGLAQPARQAIAQGEHFAKHPDPPMNKGMLNEAVQYAVYDPFHPKWREIEARHITPALDLIKNGDATAEEAVNKIINDVNKILTEKE
ncbi:MAG: sugar ABC transporter substrate-binding protein [Candidatus Omnitrophica bacterium]|nr:sugar ABC transporter substrate-binding protein [Candidatus Omnitrophota bacterium]